MDKDICVNCGQEFDRDQYHFWCNKCGVQNEKNWLAKEKMELVERIEGMKKGITTGTLGGMKAVYVDAIWDKYNQALDDVLDQLKSEEKEEVGG